MYSTRNAQIRKCRGAGCKMETNFLLLSRNTMALCGLRGQKVKGQRPRFLWVFFTCLPLWTMSKLDYTSLCVISDEGEVLFGSGMIRNEF